MASAASKTCFGRPRTQQPLATSLEEPDAELLFERGETAAHGRRVDAEPRRSHAQALQAVGREEDADVVPAP
jgi:hypothetical protein